MVWLFILLGLVLAIIGLTIANLIVNKKLKKKGDKGNGHS